MLIFWFFLCLVFFGVPVTYYLYVKRFTFRPWELKLDKEYSPPITIIVPTYNEDEIIELKLENLSRLEYPKDLTQVILIDSASTDNTVDKVQKFVKSHPEMKIDILREDKRSGKSRALNVALSHSTGKVIIVSDADCFWLPDILRNTLPYLADPAVGAIAGQEKLLNPSRSLLIKGEKIYRDRMFQIRLGESKVHSTIIFEGGFGAYKRSVLDSFDSETGCDDSGTAFNIMQKNMKTIVIPEAAFFTYFPDNWTQKILIKARRANHLVRIWLKCLKLLIKGQLPLPKKIVLPNVFLFLFNPFVFLSLILLTPILIVRYPVLSFLMLPFLIPKSRAYLIEIIQNNLIILLAFIFLITRRYSLSWRKAESRKLVDINVLRRANLI